eukprot:UN14050
MSFLNTPMRLTQEFMQARKSGQQHTRPNWKRRVTLGETVLPPYLNLKNESHDAILISEIDFSKS